jgi:hypothetical protein
MSCYFDLFLFLHVFLFLFVILIVSITNRYQHQDGVEGREKSKEKKDIYSHRGTIK